MERPAASLQWSKMLGHHVREHAGAMGHHACGQKRTTGTCSSATARRVARLPNLAFKSTPLLGSPAMCAEHGDAEGPLLVSFPARFAIVGLDPGPHVTRFSKPAQSSTPPRNPSAAQAESWTTVAPVAAFATLAAMSPRKCQRRNASHPHGAPCAKSG